MGKTFRWVSALWPVTVLALALAIAASPVAAAQPAASGPTSTTDAAALYHNYCSVCHGDKGDGKSRAAGALSTLPRDFTSADSRRELSRERIAAAIRFGRPGTAMVSWRTQLSDRDIELLADHVLRRFVQGETMPAAAAISGTRAHGGREADGPVASAPSSTVAALPLGLRGDARRGGVFYQANCATCHGARGDGAGPRAYFINPKPRNFVDPVARVSLNRVVLYFAISEGRLGTEMPAWSKVITPQQIADVAEYVFQTFIQGRAAAPTTAPTTASAPFPSVAQTKPPAKR